MWYGKTSYLLQKWYGNCRACRIGGAAHGNMFYCAQRYACAVEDLLFSRSLRNVVISRVRKCFTDDQLQTAGLFPECIMVRDGLAYFPDCVTAGDMSDIVRYLCT